MIPHGCNEFEMNSGDTLYMPKGTWCSSDEFERSSSAKRENPNLYHLAHGTSLEILSIERFHFF